MRKSAIIAGCVRKRLAYVRVTVDFRAATDLVAPPRRPQALQGPRVTVALSHPLLQVALAQRPVQTRASVVDHQILSARALMDLCLETVHFEPVPMGLRGGMSPRPPMWRTRRPSARIVGYAIAQTENAHA